MTMTTDTPGHRSVEPNPLDPGPKDEREAQSSGEHKTRTLSANIDEDLLRRLKVIAVVRDTPISALIESYLASQVRRDLKKVLVKLGD